MLIIIAGVAINLSIGENGLFNKAKQGKEQYMHAANIEQDELKNIVNFIENTNNRNDIHENEEQNNRIYLYNNGDECENITGGWEGFIYEYPNGNYGKSAGFFNKSNHTLNFGDYKINAYGDGGFKTKEPINLSSYSKICLDISSFTCNFIPRSDYPTAYNGFLITSGSTSVYTGMYRTDTAISGVIEIDISNNTLNNQISMYTGCVAWGVEGKHIATCSISAIWLEK